MDQVRRQWQAAHVGADKINTWDKVARHLVRKNSLPYDRNKPHQPSFNLSNHAMGNAENVLLIRDATIASTYEAYILQLVAKYRV